MKKYIFLCLAIFLQFISAKYDYSLDIVFNEITRSLSFLILSLICFSFVSWEKYREKCIIAAVCGFALSDLFFCIFYPLESSFAKAYAFFAVFMIYWRRDYQGKSEEITKEGIYCMRKMPDSIQDLAISILGIFGPYGGYAVVWRGEVYMFHHGVLRKYSVSNMNLSKYHIEYIGDKGGEVLEFSVGKKWHLFGSNCLTFLRKIVNNARKINLK